MHILRRFVKSSYNMHQCLRCIFGHLQWLQSLHITLANPRLAVIELHTKLQLFILSVSRDNWRWLKPFWPCLNQFNPNWADPPMYIYVFLWINAQVYTCHGNFVDVLKYFFKGFLAIHKMANWQLQGWTYRIFFKLLKILWFLVYLNLWFNFYDNKYTVSV